MKKKFILTISYDNYSEGLGGTDKFILEQQELCNTNEITILHLFPVNEIWRFDIRKYRAWGLSLDGVFSQLMSTEDIVRHIANVIEYGYVFQGIFVHHLNNINLEELSLLCESTDAHIFFYLHDYMTICPRKGLLKNSADFCGAGFPEDAKCLGCEGNSADNSFRTREINTFLTKFADRTLFVSPSEVAKQVWTNTYSQYQNKLLVIPHQVYEGEYLGNRQQIADEEPLKIAFVGYQAPVKGWGFWKDAIYKAHQQGCNYLYFQYGRCEEHLEIVREVQIDFTQDKVAMIDKLREQNIDVAILWSQCPETYSFTFYEAFAANCFILTTNVSGNIEVQVGKHKNGLIGENLEQILCDEKQLRKLVNNFRAQQKPGPAVLKINPQVLDLISDTASYSVKKRFTSTFGTRKINWLTNGYRIYKKMEMIRKKGGKLR